MNLYNDFDPYAAAWLSELISRGHLPPGCVDGRSIEELTGDELSGFTQVHLFAGIGGWPLALKLAGWPEDQPVWSGSCPCQPLSCAGKRRGEKDKRHLWPEFYRLISECRPPVIFGEQVASKDGLEWLDGISLDLEELGYAVAACDLPAASVGAPHIRQRAYWVAYSQNADQRRELQSREPTEDWRRGFTGGRESIRLADGGQPGLEVGRLEPAREECATTERSGDAGGLADTKRDDRRSDEPGRGPQGRVADGGIGGVGNAAGQRCGEARSSRSVCQDGQSRTMPAYRLGDPESRRCGIVGDATLAGNGGYALVSSWPRFELIKCRDGKTRRIPVEPAFFPLVDGLQPGRVGLLRGSGNSIVPQVAAEFIKAFIEYCNVTPGLPL